jgi:membrane-bound lytic murein transglycosylase D
MNLASGLSFYFTLNISIAVAFALVFGLRVFKPKGSKRELLSLHSLALVTVLTISVFMLAIPKQEFFQPPAKIWSAPSMKEFSRAEQAGEVNSGFFVVPFETFPAVIATDTVKTSSLIVLSLLFAAGFYFFLRDLRRLDRIRRSSHLVRRLHSVNILVSDSVSVPFSYWLPMKTNVTIPSSLLSKPLAYRLALKHELQHHRQGDTKFVYLIWFLRLSCLANPFVHLWARELAEIQEFTCNETLVDRRKVDSHAYARCLFEVAQTANGMKGVPVCATGLTFQTRGTLLKRRINTMLFQEHKYQKRSFVIASSLALVAVLTATSFASTGLVQDRRITAEQAEKMLVKMKLTKGAKTPDFPITVNDRVLRQLNRYIGTPEGREFMRNALARMENERPAIEQAMKAYGVPRELLAMPIIESGYQNLAQVDGSKARAAGLWQFIPRTAQVFGLRVDSSFDERLDVPKLTDAAMRLLVSNKMRFQDWLLSVSAYNAGEERVQEGIDKTGSRDAWTLVGRGFEGDHDYLAKLMAAILIMNSPESVL